VKLAIRPFTYASQSYANLTVNSVLENCKSLFHYVFIDRHASVPGAISLLFIIGPYSIAYRKYGSLRQALARKGNRLNLH
jgi:hypothetical protein